MTMEAERVIKFCTNCALYRGQRERDGEGSSESALVRESGESEGPWSVVLSSSSECKTWRQRRLQTSLGPESEMEGVRKRSTGRSNAAKLKASC